MKLDIAIDGASNAGKTTLVSALMSTMDAQLLPDAGDLVSVFPPAPASPERARENERYCLRVEETRATLLTTAWRRRDICLLDRSALSTLAITYGYASEYGPDIFAEQAAAMAASVRSGRLFLPQTYLYLRADPAESTARNAGRAAPLDPFWMAPALLQRQDDFYRAWMELLPAGRGRTIDSHGGPGPVLAEARQAIAGFRTPGGAVFDPAALLDRLARRLLDGHAHAPAAR
jgi:thymidylate kinase